jgi:peptidoglycan/xylan/chitin deacetylase (PgdA/CDA1 family)
MTAPSSYGAGWLLPVKSAVERVLTTGPARFAGRLRRRSQRLVLAYHNVVPNGTPATGDASLHLALDTFRRQLDDLVATGDAVSLEALLNAPSGERRIAITFDDAYAGALTLAIPELIGRGLPATIFVAPDLLGRGVPWWDRLGQQGRLTGSRRDEALIRHQGKSALIMAKGTEAVVPALLATCAIATADALIAAARHPGITIAGHTMTHPALPRLHEDELERELTASAEWLRAACPAAWRPWIAYPYGLTDDGVARAAASAGYSAGFEVSGGWHQPGTDPMRLPRFNVPAGISRSGFGIRLNGVFRE